MGSPPRVREKRKVIRKHFLSHRITPACAGKAVRSPNRQVWLRDHPRVCGKSNNIFFFELFLIGSPPRVREKRKVIRKHFLSHRITPACAGKAVRSPNRQVWLRDHPRVCGKSNNIFFFELFLIGSPPRVREKRV